MKRIFKGKLITPEHIVMITGMDLEGSERDYDYVRSSLGTGSKDLLISQYCAFYRLDYNEVRSFLFPVPSKKKWLKKFRLLPIDLEADLGITN